MILARIDGNAVATIAHPTLKGWRMVICQPIDGEGREQGDPVLAIDPIGSGLHSKVIMSSDGKAARELVGVERTPLRNMVIAVVDD